jgi:hypothetical protein
MKPTTEKGQKAESRRQGAGSRRREAEDGIVEVAALSPLGACVITLPKLSFRAEPGISLRVFSRQCEIPRRLRLLGMTRKLGLSHRLPWGRGWRAAGAFISRREPGEGVASLCAISRNSPFTIYHSLFTIHNCEGMEP